MSEIVLYTPNPCKNADFNVWMAYPGPESFALSSLGYMWLYKDLDLLDDVIVEAVNLDTTKTSIMPQDVDMIGVSISFDMDIFDVLTILDKYKIPLKSSDRGVNIPFVFAGGPVITSNPEPYKEFFDFMIIGDGEDTNRLVVEICRDNADKPRDDVLDILSKVDGVYVPSVRQEKVVKVTKKLAKCIYTPIISEKAFFKDTFIVEIERGCANRCSFCLASYINLPIRFVPLDEIIFAIDLGLQYTNKIALLGAEVTAHPQFNEILNYIYKKIKSGQQIQMSISSMRVDSFTPDVVKILVAAGQRNTTLAIEAGSERLRRVINKNLTEEQIFNAVKVAKENGLKGLKFYGMIGIPTETQEDIDSIIDLAKRIKALYKGFEISFGFSSFVPKANTPFQWHGRVDNKTLEKRAEYLRKELHKIGVQVQLPSIKWDYYQAVLSRGDENLSDYILEVYKNKLSLGVLKSVAKNLKINTDYYAIDTYNINKILPWDFIDISPRKKFLQDEYTRVMNTSNLQ